MRRDPNQEFQFEMTRSDNASGATFSLVIIDKLSSAPVLETEFNAEQFANLMSSRLTSEGIPTWFSEVPHRDRIGMHLGTVSRILSFAETVNEETIVNWADQVQRFAIPCDELSGPHRRGGSGGYQVTFRKYFPTAAEAGSWETTQGQMLADLPSPADLAKGFRFAASLAAYSAEEAPDSPAVTSTPCNKNSLFQSGESLPPCTREATQSLEVQVTRGSSKGATTTVEVCDTCARFLQRTNGLKIIRAASYE